MSGTPTPLQAVGLLVGLGNSNEGLRVVAQAYRCAPVTDIGQQPQTQA
jgi:hypothetical protein